MEIWKEVDGYGDLYAVSDLGRVRGHYGRVLVGSEAGDGYRKVILCKPGSENRHVYVHRLVLETFVGPGDQLEACHQNAIKTDNRLCNLRWGTPGENNRDIARHGNHFESNKTHCPAGHLLEAPNLVAGELRRGGRKCRACNCARAYAQRNGGGFSQSISNDYYERFIKEAQRG